LPSVPALAVFLAFSESLTILLAGLYWPAARPGYRWLALKGKRKPKNSRIPCKKLDIQAKRVMLKGGGKCLFTSRLFTQVFSILFFEGRANE